MTFPKTMTGLAAKASDAGEIEIVMVDKGQPRAGLKIPAKEGGHAAAIIMAAAVTSYAMHKNRPPLPTAMTDTPVLQATRISIGEHPTPNHCTLEMQMGEARIGFELTPPMMLGLGQALIAASAGGKPQ